MPGTSRWNNTPPAFPQLVVDTGSGLSSPMRVNRWSTRSSTPSTTIAWEPATSTSATTKLARLISPFDFGTAYYTVELQTLTCCFRGVAYPVLDAPVGKRFTLDAN